MTCAQGFLRLFWGGPKLECYGTGCTENVYGILKKLPGYYEEGNVKFEQ